MVCYPAGSSHYELVNCGHNRMHMVTTTLRLCPSNHDSLQLRGVKVCRKKKKNTSQSAAWIVDPRRVHGLQKSFKVHFYLASAHCRLRLLFVADIVFCFLSPFFTRLDGFCMWRTFSVQHFCKVNLPFCQLQPVWAYLQWPLSPFLFLTIHKTDDFRHNTPYKIVTVTSLLPSGLLFYYVLYLNLPFVSLFFVSSNFSRSVWAMTKMLVHSVTLMIPYKNLHDLKKNGRTAVPLYILSWFKCCYYLSSSLLHSEWRHERQQVISFTATSFFTWHSEGTWCTHPDHQALTLFWIDITIFWPLKIESFMHRYEYPHINPFAPLFI